MRKLILTAATVLFVVVTSVSSARGEALGSTIALDTLTRNVGLLPGSGVIAQALVEGGPGAVSTTRRAEAHLYVVAVLEGSVTYTFDNARTETYEAGQTFVIPAGVLRVFRNDGSRPVRILESVITRPGAPPPAAVVPPPTPILFRALSPGGIPFITPSPGLPDRVDVSQQAVDLDPGYRSTERVANGGNAVAVMAGFVTLRYRDGTTATYGPNSSFAIATGRPFTIVNEGPAKASYIATWLPAAGTPAQSPAAAAVQAPAAAPPVVVPPRAGDGGLASPPPADLPRWAYVVLIAGPGAILLRLATLRPERNRS